MAKFSDALRNTLTGYFDAGDQPTAAQFAALILAIQEGIEEHQHDDTGDGDGVGVLSNVTRIGVGCVSTEEAQLHNAGVGPGDHSMMLFTTGDTGALITDGFQIGYHADEYGIINVLEDKPLYLATNNTAWVALLNTGYLGVNQLVPVYRFETVTDHAGGYAGYFFNDGNAADRYGIGIQCGQDAAAGTGYPVTFIDGDGDANGSIRIINGVPAFVNRSDESLKDDIRDTKKKGLETILGLKVRDYRWKSCPKMELTTGFVAQEVEMVMPVAAPEREGLKGVAMGMFMPMVVKAIQELDARLTQGGL